MSGRLANIEITRTRHQSPLPQNRRKPASNLDFSLSAFCAAPGFARPFSDSDRLSRSTHHHFHCRVRNLLRPRTTIAYSILRGSAR